MKKFAVLMLCLALLLCACGAQEAPETTGAAEPAQTAAGTAAPTVPADTEPPTETVTEPVNAELERAKTCIDKSVEELYALIGEPESSDYAPSCLGDGEDGNLYYDGFTVYTYKEGDTETVRYVE